MLFDIFVVEQQGFSYEKYKHGILFVHAFSWLIMGLKNNKQQRNYSIACTRVVCSLIWPLKEITVHLWTLPRTQP